MSKFLSSSSSHKNPSLGPQVTSYSDTQPSAPPCYEEAMAGSNFVFPYPQPPTAIMSLPIQAVQPVSAAPQATSAHLLVGPRPLKATCPSCNKYITSKTTKKNNCKPYICCLILLLTGVCTLCSCVPFCTCPPLKVEHFCPNCRAFLGAYVDC